VGAAGSGGGPPEAKKQKVADFSAIEALIPAGAFAAQHSGPYTITVVVPVDSSSAFNLQGQNVTLTVSAGLTVKDLKESLAGHLAGLAANKQQLKNYSGFLKDAASLAFLNIGPGAGLELSVKTRGGKK
jgi:hypothetical protein